MGLDKRVPTIIEYILTLREASRIILNPFESRESKKFQNIQIERQLRLKYGQNSNCIQHYRMSSSRIQQDNTDICDSAINCEECLGMSRKCFWYENSRKSYCFNIGGGSLNDRLTSLYGEVDNELENVSWGSCKAPLTVSLFLLFSIVLVLIIFVAFVTVHFVCSNNKETEMLIEADLAAQNEKYLERLGKLNPLPFKTQD